ncbi:MAG: hypothetical protein CTY18_07945 [Methylomonas sp.]|nr:MAG: hypothetical protein CTY18_07945 [Methylomonas sp.]
MIWQLLIFLTIRREKRRQQAVLATSFKSPWIPLMPKWLKQVIPYRFWPSTLLRHWLEKRGQGRVLSGPFTGMRYLNTSIGSQYEPKLLGTYELELSPIITELAKLPFQIVVDAGAAEGYYAVGMATLLPACRIISFESSPKGQALQAQMASLNGVTERLTINGLCTPESLSAALPQTGNALLIMDVEGAERELLNLTATPALRQTHILVEMHDFLDPNLQNLIRQRFENSHQIRLIPIQQRSLEDYPFALPAWARHGLKDTLLEAISEKRHPDSSWLFMTPKPI